MGSHCRWQANIRMHEHSLIAEHYCAIDFKSTALMGSDPRMEAFIQNRPSKALEALIHFETQDRSFSYHDMDLHLPKNVNTDLHDWTARPLFHQWRELQLLNLESHPSTTFKIRVTLRWRMSRLIDLNNKLISSAGYQEGCEWNTTEAKQCNSWLNDLHWARKYGEGSKPADRFIQPVITNVSSIHWEWGNFLWEAVTCSGSQEQPTFHQPTIAQEF